MDRQIVYPGAIPLDTDFTLAMRSIMVALGYTMEATYGSTTVINGLQCLPTSPTPSLNVTVGRGMIAALNVIDQYAYGSLSADTSDPLMKMGINTATTTFTITPPSTAGYSQNYLIEVQFQEQDTTPIVLPYYNMSNPSIPYSGPANSGTAQNTQVTQRAQLQLKAGTPAAAGTQATPGADSGWTPLWVVSVNNGQTQITSSSISIAPGAPILLTQLSQLPQKLMGNLSLYVSATGNDTYNGRSAATPFLTIQAAINSVFNNYNLAGYQVTINVGAGSFGAVSVTGLATGQTSPINIVGAGSGNTTFAGTIAAYQSADIGVASGTITGGFSSNSGANINVNNNIVAGACSGPKLYAAGGTITLGSSYTDTGNAPAHYQMILGGQINSFGNITVTEVGTPAYSTAYCLGIGGNFSNLLGSITFVGSATGVRFSSTMGAQINTNTGNTSYFPGSTAGTTGTGTNTGFYN